MFKLLPLFLSLFLFTLPLSAATTKPSEIARLRAGKLAFNNAPELAPFFRKLRDDYAITTAVETGTFFGATTAFFAKTFEEVHTIEISPEIQSRTKELLAPFTNIQFHLGSSEEILASLLPSLQDRTLLFYLDAHWNDHWPLLEELETINKTHHNRCIIVIDDVKVPGRNDIPYDSYGEHECSFEYVREKIEQLFDDYAIDYLIPNHPTSRAKLVIFNRTAQRAEL